MGENGKRQILRMFDFATENATQPGQPCVCGGGVLLQRRKRRRRHTKIDTDGTVVNLLSAHDEGLCMGYKVKRDGGGIVGGAKEA